MTSKIKYIQRHAFCFLLFLFFAAIESDVLAAEKILIKLEDKDYEIPVSILKEYAEDKTRQKIMPTWLTFIDVKKPIFRDYLGERHRFSPKIIDNYFNSAMGTLVLKGFSELFQNEDGSSSLRSLHSALAKAARHPQGFRMFDVIEKFPGNIRINNKLLLKIYRNSEKPHAETIKELESKGIVVLTEKKQNSEQLNQESINIGKNNLDSDATNKKLNYRQLYLNDSLRKRRFSVNLYWPKMNEREPTPLVVISPSFGQSLKSQQETAKYFALQGFAVAVVDHPGSNFLQYYNFISEASTNLLEAEEFLNRPLDIKFTLDELTRLNRSLFKSQLNVENVGVTGRSLGGTTALSVAGSSLNFNQLNSKCQPQEYWINYSFLFQCLALKLPRQSMNLKDARVKAIFVQNPPSGALFGPAELESIKLPVLWEASAKDGITPFATEQIPSFLSLGTPKKYLMDTQGDTHLNIPVESLIKNMERRKFKDLDIETKPLVENYRRSMATAFFKVYLSKDMKYQMYLQKDK
jgi:predicted dienelactone hydrolase